MQRIFWYNSSTDIPDVFVCVIRYLALSYPQDNLWTSTDGEVQLEIGKMGDKCSNSLFPPKDTQPILEYMSKIKGSLTKWQHTDVIFLMLCSPKNKAPNLINPTRSTSTLCINIFFFCLSLQGQTSHKANALPSARPKKRRINKNVLKYSNPVG